MKFEYLTCCTELTHADAPELHAMIEERIEVSFDTFRRNCAWKPLAHALGYRVGRRGSALHLKDDWAVHFYRSFFKGKPCYYMDWSRIEHIFVEPAEDLLDWQNSKGMADALYDPS